MWIVVGFIIVLIFLLGVIRLVRAKREINKLHFVLENVRDIVYYCEVPALRYHYLSPVMKTWFGQKQFEEHLKNPDKIFEIVHPDDYDTLMKKKLGQLDYRQPIQLRLKNEGGYTEFSKGYASVPSSLGQMERLYMEADRLLYEEK